MAPPPGKGRPDPQLLAQTASRPKPFDAIDTAEDARVASGIDEFDRVLGGGIVPGSLVLIGGEPGIGKSTLLLQVAHLLGRTHGTRALRLGRGVGAPDQAARRAARDRGRRPLPDGRDLARADPRAGREPEAARRSSSTRSRPSSRRASRPPPAASARCARWRRSCCSSPRAAAITTFLIGHVTKDGSLAGPKSLEHIVDTVLYFEGEKRQHHRIVRAVKNRFGAVSELGVFEMTGAGLQPVANPSALFLAERQAGAAGLGGGRHDRGHAPDAGRGAGARVAHVVRHAAAHVARHRPQPHQPAARRAREAGRARAPGRRRVRERGRRARGRRARRRPRRGRGRRVLVPQPPAARRTRCSSARWASAARCAAPARPACASARPRRWASPAASCPPATCRTTPRRGSGSSASTRSRKRSSGSRTDARERPCPRGRRRYHCATEGAPMMPIPLHSRSRSRAKAREASSCGSSCFAPWSFSPSAGPAGTTTRCPASRSSGLALGVARGARDHRPGARGSTASPRTTWSAPWSGASPACSARASCGA